MLSIPLPLVEKNCGIEIEEMLQGVMSRKIAFNNMLHFCRISRRIGVTKFFITGQGKFLLENLSKSAHAFAFYLQGPLTKDVCLSQCEPYFDALACGDLSAQQTIRTRAPSAWNKDYEYEDDFLYLRFVLHASESPQPDKIGEDILKRFEAVLDGQSDARFDLCKALYERDADAFNPHLFQWLKKQSADNDGLIEADNIDPDHAVTTARLSVEGLAWLKLAEQRGLPVHDEYPLIPSLARVSITLPAADAWKQIESYFDLPHG